MTATAIYSNDWNPPRAEGAHLRGLSLVAAGACCLFLTEFLAQLELETGSDTRDLFDVIGGTSSGALVAAALNQGVPAQEIGEAFTQFAPRIYSKRPFPFSLTGHWFKSPYSQEALRDLFISLVGKENAKLLVSQIGFKILLPTWVLESQAQSDLVAEQTIESEEDLGTVQEISLEDVVIASMATPGQFSPVKLNGREMVDPSYVTSPVSNTPDALMTAGMDISNLKLLSLRATPSLDFNAGDQSKPGSSTDQKLNFLARHQKSLMDSMPSLTAAQAGASARSKFGERFVEFGLLIDGLDVQPNSYQPDHLALIKEAAVHEFHRFSSGEHRDQFSSMFSPSQG